MEEVYDLRKQEKQVKDSVSTSGANAAYNEKASLKTLNNLKRLEANKMKDLLYGSGKDEEVKAPQTLKGIHGALDKLQMPLYGVVGAAKNIVGQGSGSGIGNDIWQNVTKNKDLFSNVLSTAGAPKWLSATAGFGLDMALDPVNLFTAGTGTLVGRGAKGLAQAGEVGLEAAVKGSAKGVAAMAGQDAISLARFVPGLGKAKWLDTAATKVGKMEDDFYRLTGLDMFGDANAKTILPGFGKRVVFDGAEEGMKSATFSSILEDTIKKVFPKFETEKFRYSPSAWFKDSVTDEALGKSGMKLGTRTTSEVAGEVPLSGTYISSDLQRAENVMKGDMAAADAIASGELGAGYRESGQRFTQNMAAEAVADKEVRGSYQRIMKLKAQQKMKETGIDWYDRTKRKVNDFFRQEKTVKFNNTTGDVLIRGDLVKRKGDRLVRTIKKDEAIGRVSQATEGAVSYQPVDVKGWDMKWVMEGMDLADEVKFKQTPGGAVLDALESLTSLFKTSKVVLSLGGHVNAFVGQFAHRAMMGINPVGTAKYLPDAYKIYAGTIDPEKLMTLLTHDLVDMFKNEGSFLKAYAKAPNTMRATYGASLDMLLDKNWKDKMFKAVMADMGKEGVANSRKVFDEMFDDFLKQTSKFQDQLKTASPQEIARIKEGILDGFEARKTGSVSGAAQRAMDVGESSQLMSLNLDRGLLNAWLLKEAQNGNAMAKGWVNMVDKAGSVFESHDFAAKLADSLYMTKDGITTAELNKISRMMSTGITSKDIIKTVKGKNGETRHILDWMKAAEIANETHLQYAAMPAFVRMMREMPILGMPFFSFTYGSMPKFAKTLMHNPAGLNKVEYFKKELGGEKTALEKWAMDPANPNSKYYEYLASGDFMRIPFFRENPSYISIANMIPYYSFNMMNPSERNYEAWIPDKIMKIIDRTGIAAGPDGQLVLNYILVPLMLMGTDEQALNSFGQPVVPKGTGVVGTGARALRDLVESVTPVTPAGVAGIVGGTLHGPNVTEYMPSYHYRRSAYASQGRTASGVPITDDAKLAEQKAKAIAGLFNATPHRVNLDYINPPKN